MNPTEIRKYLNRLNKGKSEESIFTRPISKTVDLAKVWFKSPKKDATINSSVISHDFFFIKNSMGIYVSGIYDMGYDLHWYVLPKYRKQGYLSNALKNTILPYIFDYLREVQYISISESIGKVNYNNSLKVASNLGFSPSKTDETQLELSNTDFELKNVDLFYQNKGLNESRVNILRQKVNYASKLLMQESDELNMAFDSDDNLSDIAKEVYSFTAKIEDLMFNNDQSDAYNTKSSN